MRKLLLVAGLLGALAIPVAAPSAVLEKGAGATCASGVGTWNFVNNKTEGAAAGTLTVFFDTEEFGVIQFGPVGPTVVNKSVQKFTLFTNNRATLVSASTNLPGKLVLESVGCAPFVIGALWLSRVASIEPATDTAALSSGEEWTVGPTCMTRKTREYFVNARTRRWTASSFSIGPSASHPPELSSRVVVFSG